MLEIEREHGATLDALAELRDVSLSEWSRGADPKTDVGMVIMAIWGRAIGVLDAVRMLLDHGQSDEAIGLTRTLFDLEIDAFLLATGDQDLMSRYVLFQLWEEAAMMARMWPWLDPDEKDSNRRTHLDRLKSGFQKSARKPPEGFQDMDLAAAAEAFAKSVFGHRYPHSWRVDMEWEQTVERVAAQHVRVFEGSGKTEADWKAELNSTARLGYALMSSFLHGSPMSVGSRLKFGSSTAVVVGARPVLIPLAADWAATHIIRLHQLVVIETNLPTDQEAWARLRSRLKEPGT